MSETYIGVVKKVFNKNGRWSLLMDDDNWYGLNRSKPEGVEDGHTVKFAWSANGQYRNVEKDTLKINRNVEKQEQKGATAGSSRGGSAAKDQYWADKEARDIEYQKNMQENQKRISMAGAINSATTLVNSALELGYLKLPGGQKATMDAYVAAVIQQAEDLYPVIQTAAERHEQLMDTEIDADVQTPEDLRAEDAPTGDDDGWE